MILNQPDIDLETSLHKTLNQTFDKPKTNFKWILNHTKIRPKTNPDRKPTLKKIFNQAKTKPK